MFFKSKGEMKGVMEMGSWGPHPSRADGVCPSGGSAPVGGRPPASSADSILVLKSRRFGKRGEGHVAFQCQEGWRQSSQRLADRPNIDY